MMRLLIISTALLLAVSQAQAQSTGTLRGVGDALEVWHAASERWVTPPEYFSLELTRLNGPTYGRVREYPAYESVSEWQTLIDVLPDGRECPMVFFHERWRRLPDVLALDERLREYGGCRDVFNN